jgi:hypothetical protein
MFSQISYNRLCRVLERVQWIVWGDENIRRCNMCIAGCPLQCLVLTAHAVPFFFSNSFVALGIAIVEACLLNSHTSQCCLGQLSHHMLRRLNLLTQPLETALVELGVRCTAVQALK